MPRSIAINQPLVLFRAESGDFNQHQIVPRGSYAVEPVPNPLNRKSEPWLKIVGQPWANARACWEVVSNQPPKNSRFEWQCQIAGGILALLCVCLSALTFAIKSWTKPPPDIAAMKMELSGLDNELENLPRHYPLILSPVQKLYEDRSNDAIYGLDVYPRYVAYRNCRQSEILRRRGDLDGFISALNALDEQLYHAWHDWGLTNRAALIADLKKQRARFTSGQVMLNQSQIYASLQVPILKETMIEPCLAFNERLEQEIADTDSSLREVARQNRDCADRAIKLNVRINVLRAELAAVEKRGKSFQTAGVTR